jgi:hypothetical protein
MSEMRTNEKGYPIIKKDGKWYVGEYSEDQKKRQHRFTDKNAAVRVAKQWNSMAGCFG